MKDLIVSETFGPTIQGEGPDAGRIAYFVRLGLCNLDCAWCDTSYTWDFAGKVGPKASRDAFLHMEPTQLAELVLHATRPGQIVVVTGGEPMLQQRQLAVLCGLLSPHREVHVETNGTLAPIDELVDHVARWVVSPKVAASAQVEQTRAIRDDVLAKFVSLNAAFKFVISDRLDVAAVDRLVWRTEIPKAAVWLMPEGRDAATLVACHEWLADVAVRHGFNMCSRLHVLTWGDKRGV